MKNSQIFIFNKDGDPLDERKYRKREREENQNGKNRKPTQKNNI